MILKESKNKKAMIAIIDQMGLDGASEFLGIPIYELIEMGVVESYDGDLILRGTPIKSLGNLESVGGNLDLRKTPIKSLGKLRKVGDSLNLGKSEIEDLGKLKYVGGDLFLSGSEIKSLGDLEEVGGYLYLRNTPISMSKYDIMKKIKVRGILMVYIGN
jgi:hypothetical protein